MKQKQQSAVTTGGEKNNPQPAHTDGGRRRRVREHAINQLTSDLDQEKTEGGATTQTWKTWKRGLTQQDRITCRTPENRSRLHLRRISPGTSHQSLVSAPAGFPFYSDCLLGWCRNAAGWDSTWCRPGCFTDTSFMGPLKTREEPPSLHFCSTWAEGAKAKGGRAPCCSCQEVKPLGCCISPPICEQFISFTS